MKDWRRGSRLPQGLGSEDCSHGFTILELLRGGPACSQLCCIAGCGPFSWKAMHVRATHCKGREQGIRGPASLYQTVHGDCRYVLAADGHGSPLKASEHTISDLICSNTAAEDRSAALEQPAQYQCSRQCNAKPTLCYCPCLLAPGRSQGSFNADAQRKQAATPREPEAASFIASCVKCLT
jgi:hypothetical protein